MESDEAAMVVAIAEARLAGEHGDVPVGAVVLRDGHVIAQRHNEREAAGDPTAHAELLALRDAAKVVGHWRLGDCTLVVTLEPCFMCAGALVNARVKRLVFGARDERFGAVESVFRLCDASSLNHQIEVVSGVLAEDCRRLMRDFFRARRNVKTI